MPLLYSLYWVRASLRIPLTTLLALIAGITSRAIWITSGLKLSLLYPSCSPRKVNMYAVNSLLACSALKPCWSRGLRALSTERKLAPSMDCTRNSPGASSTRPIAPLNALADAIDRRSSCFCRKYIICKASLDLPSRMACSATSSTAARRSTKETLAARDLFLAPFMEP